MENDICFFLPYQKTHVSTAWKNIFASPKFLKRTEKVIFRSNENVRKQHLTANEYSLVNMAFSHLIVICKDEIFYVASK